MRPSMLSPVQPMLSVGINVTTELPDVSDEGIGMFNSKDVVSLSTMPVPDPKSEVHASVVEEPTLDNTSATSVAVSPSHAVALELAHPMTGISLTGTSMVKGAETHIVPKPSSYKSCRWVSTSMLMSKSTASGMVGQSICTDVVRQWSCCPMWRLPRGLQPPGHCSKS